jgi:hypothetical protein
MDKIHLVILNQQKSATLDLGDNILKDASRSCMKAIACSLFIFITLSAASTVAYAQDDPQVPKIAYKVMDSLLACMTNGLEVSKERKPETIPFFEQQIASLTKARADLSLAVRGDPKRHLRGEGAAALAKEFNGHARAGALDLEMSMILDFRNVGGDATKCEVAYNSIR